VTSIKHYAAGKVKNVNIILESAAVCKKISQNTLSTFSGTRYTCI